jgi:hypothetical protein
MRPIFRCRISFILAADFPSFRGGEAEPGIQARPQGRSCPRCEKAADAAGWIPDQRCALSGMTGVKCVG